MFCKNCGAQMNDNQKFCPNCGTPVQQSETVQTQEIPGSPQVIMHTSRRLPAVILRVQARARKRAQAKCRLS